MKRQRPAPLIPVDGGSDPDRDAEAHSETDGTRRVARDEYGWVRGIRWARGKGGGYCPDPSRAPTDYLGPNPVVGRVSRQERESRRLPAGVRTCGVCCTRGAQ